MKIINIKKTDENAKIPTYGSEFAAGADLYAVIHNEKNRVEILPGETAFIDTGIVMEIPHGYVGLIYARSGLSCKQGLKQLIKSGELPLMKIGNDYITTFSILEEWIKEHINEEIYY